MTKPVKCKLSTSSIPSYEFSSHKKSDKSQNRYILNYTIDGSNYTNKITIRRKVILVKKLLNKLFKM